MQLNIRDKFGVINIPGYCLFQSFNFAIRISDGLYAFRIWAQLIFGESVKINHTCIPELRVISV